MTIDSEAGLSVGDDVLSDWSRAHIRGTEKGRSALETIAVNQPTDPRLRYATLRRLESAGALERISAAETAARSSGKGTGARPLAINAREASRWAETAQARAALKGPPTGKSNQAIYGQPRALARSSDGGSQGLSSRSGRK